MPGVIATLITVTAVAYTRFGETIIGSKVTRNIVGNRTRTIGTILHVDEHAAVIEQTSHLVVVVGTRQDSVPIIIVLVVEIHAQQTGQRRNIRLGSRAAQRITDYRKSLTHSHSHATYIGTAAGAAGCSRAEAVIRHALVPGNRYQGIDAVTFCTSHHIAGPTVVALQGRGFTGYLYLVGIFLQPAFYPFGLAFRYILAVERVAQQRVYRIFGRNQGPSPFFKTYDVVHGNTLLRNGFYCGISAFERRAATHG